MGQRQPGAWKTRPDVVDLRIAPSVNRLLRVADHGHVAEALGGREPDEVQLDAVGVLELVHDQVAESLPAAPAEFRHPLQGVDHAKQQVVEVAEILCPERVLVGAVDGEEHLDGLCLRARGVGPA